MKKLLTLTLLLSLFSTAYAQEKRDNFGIGFQLSDWGGDFGVGVNVSGPEFFGVITIDAAFQSQWRSNYFLYENAWDSYQMLELGLRSKAGQIANWFEMYGFARACYLISGPDSWSTGQFGATGGFGFEFNTAASGQSPVSYFIELGSHSGFQDVTPFEVSITGGFSSTVGLRVNF
ncbi:MAG: hypothetical protein HWD92_07720 [Flavobacteriia bacterium]|nr:hypothetical protein [Flavobacteriia bacterium]